MDKEIKFRQKLKPEYVKSYGDSFHYWGYVDEGFTSPFGANQVVGSSQQFSGLQDSKGVDIYEGDSVYLAGYGVYEVEFPFYDLYEAKMENDVGEIVVS